MAVECHNIPTQSPTIPMGSNGYPGNHSGSHQNSQHSQYPQSNQPVPPYLGSNAPQYANGNFQPLDPNAQAQYPPGGYNFQGQQQNAPAVYTAQQYPPQPAMTGPVYTQAQPPVNLVNPPAASWNPANPQYSQYPQPYAAQQFPPAYQNQIPLPGTFAPAQPYTNQQMPPQQVYHAVQPNVTMENGGLYQTYPSPNSTYSPPQNGPPLPISSPSNDYKTYVPPLQNTAYQSPAFQTYPAAAQPVPLPIQTPMPTSFSPRPAPAHTPPFINQTGTISPFNAPPIVANFAPSAPPYQPSPPQRIVSPTPSSDTGNTAIDIDKLYQAIETPGVNETQIITILSERSLSQMRAINEAYKLAYRRDLADHLNSVLRGSFGRLAVNLAKPPSHVDADNLYQAIHSAGSDKELFIEVDIL